MKNHAVPVHVLFELAIPGPPAFYTTICMKVDREAV